MLKGLANANPVWGGTIDPVIPVSRNQPPLGWKAHQNPLCVTYAHPLGPRVATRQVDPTHSIGEYQVPRVIDPMSVQGDVTRGVTRRVGYPEGE